MVYEALHGESEEAAPAVVDEDGNAVDPNAAEALATAFTPRAAKSSASYAGAWTPAQVGQWVADLGLPAYASLFERHAIGGRELTMLSEAHMAEMGIDTVGHRLLLQRKIGALNLVAADDGVLWSTRSVKSYNGVCDWLYKKKVKPCVRKLTCKKPGFLDEYVMTASVLVITQRKRLRSDVCLGGWQVKTITRHVQLETITAATASSTTATRFDFGEADIITIELDKMKMLRPVQPLVVAKGEGGTVVRAIMEAVHQRKMAIAGATPQVMAR
ncbi:hypothetical protein AB1Y20_004430 [Prymnesium parvum]|uniref:SAM domain-containing protein n=1 Tax=Prymnesium parvum TaxID=97485 RepID=A0AB34IWU3_PRYPA